MTETLYCPYCLEAYTHENRGRYRWQWAAAPMTCGKAICKGRMTAWRAWVRNTNAAAIGGDVNLPTPKAAYRLISRMKSDEQLIPLLFDPEPLEVAA